MVNVRLICLKSIENKSKFSLYLEADLCVKNGSLVEFIQFNENNKSIKRYYYKIIKMSKEINVDENDISKMNDIFPLNIKNIKMEIYNKDITPKTKIIDPEKIQLMINYKPLPYGSDEIKDNPKFYCTHPNWIKFYRENLN